MVYSGSGLIPFNIHHPSCRSTLHHEPLNLPNGGICRNYIIDTAPDDPPFEYYMGFVFAGKSPTIWGIRRHFHEVAPSRPELSIANKERDKISKKAKAKREAGVQNSAEYGGSGNTSVEIAFINFTTLQKILKIIYQYISRCVIS